MRGKIPHTLGEKVSTDLEERYFISVCTQPPRREEFKIRQGKNKGSLAYISRRTPKVPSPKGCGNNTYTQITQE